MQRFGYIDCRDHDGPEVDYVLDYNRQYLPIEVKYTHKPTADDARHLKTFIHEYDCQLPALIVCRVERPIEIVGQVLAINWHDLPEMVARFFDGDV